MHQDMGEEGEERLTGVSKMNLDLCSGGSADRFPFKYISLRIWQVVPMATVAHLRIVCACVLVHVFLCVCVSHDLLA